MNPSWKFWLVPTVFATPWIAFFMLSNINTPPPHFDARALWVILIIGTYGVFLIPYWFVASFRQRRWGLFVPLALVNLFWLSRGGVQLISEHNGISLADEGAWAFFGVHAAFMLVCSLIVAIVYAVTRWLRKILLRGRPEGPTPQEGLNTD